MAAWDILIVWFGGHPGLDSVDGEDEEEGGVKPIPFILSEPLPFSLTPSKKKKTEGSKPADPRTVQTI